MKHTSCVWCARCGAYVDHDPWDAHSRALDSRLDLSATRSGHRRLLRILHLLAVLRGVSSELGWSALDTRSLPE